MYTVYSIYGRVYFHSQQIHVPETLHMYIDKKLYKARTPTVWICLQKDTKTVCISEKHLLSKSIWQNKQVGESRNSGTPFCQRSSLTSINKNYYYHAQWLTAFHPKWRSILLEPILLFVCVMHNTQFVYFTTLDISCISFVVSNN